MTGIEPSNILGALLQHTQAKFYAVGMMYSINARMSFQRKVDSNTMELVSIADCLTRPQREALVDRDHLSLVKFPA